MLGCWFFFYSFFFTVNSFWEFHFYCFCAGEDLYAYRKLVHIIDMHLFYKNCVLPSLPSYELRRGLMMLTLRELCCEQSQMSHSMPAVKALLDVNNFCPLPRDLVGAPMTRGPESRVHQLGKSNLPFFFFQKHIKCTIVVTGSFFSYCLYIHSCQSLLYIAS